MGRLAASFLALATHADTDNGGTVSGFGIVPLICNGSWLCGRTMPRTWPMTCQYLVWLFYFLAGKVFF